MDAITGLIMAGSQIVIALKPYFSHPDVATLAQTAHSEIHDFSYALIKLKPMIDGSEPLNSARATQIDIGQLSMTIAGCMVTFSVLEKEVDSMNDMLAGGKKKIAVLARRKWSRMETTINTVIQRLQNHKGSLTLIFVILTW
ncbi:hypothetical protein DFP73DRAFT_560921 [Morchella snyderi]|nr:hypothetical protein DFP73DRAFT_560921 [Morchella snyderi]